MSNPQINELEALAVSHAIDSFRGCISGRHVCLYVDNSSTLATLKKRTCKRLCIESGSVDGTPADERSVAELHASRVHHVGAKSG